jgi:periplasmic protein TorT
MRLGKLLSRLAWRPGCFALSILLAPTPAISVELVRWEPPFSYSGQGTVFDFTPPEKATRPWQLCVIFPHIKDAYWQAINYGMIDEARRLGVSLRIFEAGGYPNIERQKDLIRECAGMPKTDAIILGTVSFAGLSDIIKQVSQHKLVLATVNDIANDGLSAKVGVPYYEMGYQIGRYIADRHREAASPVEIAWFPGPRKAGWVPFVDRGFRDAIKRSRISIVSVGWGDTDKTVQRNLVQSALDQHPQIKYLIGNAMMAEAAVSVLRERTLEDRIAIASTYLTPGVYRGIVRHKILASPTDSPVIQARLSIAQAVSLLEKRPVEKHMGPVIKIVDQDNLDKVPPEESMPPPTFSPQFSFDPQPARD